MSKRRTVLREQVYALPNQRTAYRNPDPAYIDLVFTGTIVVNGVFDAINITKQLHALNNKVKLRIVGYCALKRDL